METLATEVVMTEQNRIGAGGSFMPGECVESLLREYDASSPIQAEFARRAGVKYPTFDGCVRARRVSTVRSGSAVARCASRKCN